MFEVSMDNAFRMLEQRSLRPGRGNHQYWYLSAACSLVGIQFDPGRTQALEKQATDRVCKLAYKILSLQDEDQEDDLGVEVRVLQVHQVRALRPVVNRSSSGMPLRLQRLMPRILPKSWKQRHFRLQTHWSINRTCHHSTSWMTARHQRGCWTISGSWMGYLP